MQKRKIYLFILLLIVIFPMLLECMYFLITKGAKNIICNDILKNILDVIRTYISYYATVFSISFAMYQFNKSQQKIEEDRQNQKKKENELREKEIEAKKDYYRPTFIIVKENGKEKVKLLMRNDNLYIEDIFYYKVKINIKDNDVKLEITYPTKINSAKSGEDIFVKDCSLFYIAAKTQIGETILFGYLNGGYKLYKYLKEKGNPFYPNVSDSRNFKYSKEIVNKNWGTYNNKINEKLEEFFFYNLFCSIKNGIIPFYGFMENTMNAESTETFLKSFFKEIIYEYKYRGLSDDIVFYTIQFLFNAVDFDKNSKCFEIKNNKNVLEDFNSNLVNDKILDKNFDLKNIIDLVGTKLFEIKGNGKYAEFIKLLKILHKIFKNITVSSNLDCELNKYKTIVLNKLIIK